MTEIIGAEAKITIINDRVIKYRLPKKYRIPILDAKLRKQRTKREATLLQKLQSIISVPKVYTVSSDTIIMQYLPYPKVRDALTEKTMKLIAKEIGKSLACMHNEDVIHGDVTTSNMLFDEKNKKVYVIDFGLGVVSQRVEDKAVDLHILRQALESYHYLIWKKTYALILAEYKKNSKQANEIIERLKIVEARGRNKHE